jgi:RNA polymerase sigma-70 factor (ECF subfamily)
MDEQIRVKELAALIEKEIAALPPKMQEIFILSKQEDLSYKEIALQLNISDKTAKQQVYNAVKLLRLKVASLLRVLFLL